MEARALVQQHEAATNRIVTIICWVALILVVAVLQTLGPRFGMDGRVFALWATGSLSLLAVGTLLIRVGWLPWLHKYLMISLVSTMVISIAFLLEGANQHLGIWYLAPILAALYMHRRVAVFASLLNLAGWVAILVIKPPGIAAGMTVQRLGLVNAVLLLIVGIVVWTIADRFRRLMQVAAEAANREAILERLDQMVTEAQRTTAQLAATSSGLTQVGQSAATQAEQQLRPTVRRLEAANQRATDSAREALDGMEQLTQLVVDLAQAAQEQTEQTTSASYLVREMAGSASEMAGLAQGIATEARSTAQAAVTGGESVSRSAQHMTSLDQAVGSAAQQMERLCARSEQIGAVVTTIEQFTGQTSMLALNAAIEAARAGEAGRGFAVVAQEVGTLAARSAQATAEIARLIREVQSGIDQSRIAMGEAHQRASAGVALSQSAQQSLAALQAAIQRTADSAGRIASQSGLMSDRSRRLVTTMEQLAAIAEENAAASEEMAATSERVLEQGRSIGEAAKASGAVAVEVASATDSISHLVNDIARSAGALDQVAASLAAVTGRAS